MCLLKAISALKSLYFEKKIESEKSFIYHLPSLKAFFCGQHRHCVMFNNRQALIDAIRNLDREYLIVGLVEELETSYALLEKALPRYFTGLTSLDVSKCRLTQLIIPYMVVVSNFQKSA